MAAGSAASREALLSDTVPCDAQRPHRHPDQGAALAAEACARGTTRALVGVVAARTERARAPRRQPLQARALMTARIEGAHALGACLAFTRNGHADARQCACERWAPQSIAARTALSPEFGRTITAVSIVVTCLAGGSQGTARQPIADQIWCALHGVARLAEQRVRGATPGIRRDAVGAIDTVGTVAGVAERDKRIRTESVGKERINPLDTRTVTGVAGDDVDTRSRRVCRLRGHGAIRPGLRAVEIFTARLTCLGRSSSRHSRTGRKNRIETEGSVRLRGLRLGQTCLCERRVQIRPTRLRELSCHAAIGPREGIELLATINR